jgi:DNA-directed RNA polymerase subunit beta'
MKSLKFNSTTSFSDRSFVFFNQVITKKDLEELLSWMFRNYGIRKTCMLAELLKEAGFNYATQGGLSINIEDLKVPRSKTSLVSSTNKELEKGEILYNRGQLTSSEWFQKQVMAWNLTSELLKNEIVEFFELTDPLNPLYMMTFSGARGNLSQVRQLIGMRGLMSDQKGEMIGSAIQKNFREGLTVIDFLISSYGARKGLVDTAIRTADSGYMTRRLIDIAQDVVIRQFDCQAKNGVLILETNPFLKPIVKSSFDEKLLGRILAKPLVNPKNQQILAHRGQQVDFNILKNIKDSQIKILSVRSPLTCQSYRSVCQTCFGWDLTQHRLIEIGEAIGIIAAQSIGEPGTQLTMRTFHTGGVFSRELSQQIRSKFSGQVIFAENMNTNFIRTNQGDYAQVIINTSFFDIKTYKNETIRIKVERDDLIMIKNREFIKKGQPIVQSAAQLEESDTEVQKTLSTKFPGEIYYEPKQSYNFFEYNMVVWLLAGKLVILPFESKQFLRQNVNFYQTLAKTKLVIKSNPYTETIRVLNKNKLGLIYQFQELQKIKIFKIKNLQQRRFNGYILNFRNSNLIKLRKDIAPENFSTENGYLGKYITSKYQVKTGGTLYNLSFNRLLNFNPRNKFTKLFELNNGGCVLWLPEEIYQYFPNNLLSNFNEGVFLKKKTFLFSNKVSPIKGIIRQQKQTKKINSFIIFSGVILVFNKSNICLKTFYKMFNQKFFFPGEILFGKIKIDKIVFTDLIETTTTIKLIIRPLTLYNITKPSLSRPITQINPVNNDEILVKVKKYLTIKFNEKNWSKNKRIINLIETGLFLNFSADFMKYQNNLSGYFINDGKTWSLEFGRLQQLTDYNINPRRLKFQQIFTIFSVKPKQILEPYSIIGNSEVYGETKNKILDIKSKYSKRYQSQELLIVSSDQIRNLYFEEKNSLLENKKFLYAGDVLGSNLILTVGGKILKNTGTKISFRIGKPYLFTEGAKVYKNHQDFAPENTVLGFVTYRIFKTQDIIQGLPKVEEILEARSSSDKAFIADKSGLITRIVSHPRSRSSQIEILSNIKNYRTIREVPYIIEEIDKESLEVEPYQYINLTDKFHKGLVDPQQLLDIYFDYFRQRDSHQKATLRSLYRLASMFIKSIQGVYQNQGIKIVDRHLEVIVRQMILKAKIENPGTTPLVSGEYLDVQQLVALNVMLNKKQKNLVFYKPALLGLTKAALTTESFISAASFQETIRILTQAAIEGKIDWLRGLKEKVIVGGLIPCGTGVLTFLDEWITKHIFLYGRSTISVRTRRKFLRKKLENQTAFLPPKKL